MHLHPHEVALGTIRGDFDNCDGNVPDPRDFFTLVEAVAFLEDLTGECFGRDVDRWTKWFNGCPPDLLDEFYDAYVDLMHSPKGRYFDQMRRYANETWKDVTERRCPKCGSLCPEYRSRCSACRHVLGRG